VQRPAGTRLQEIAVRRQLKAPLYAYGCKPFAAHPELRDDFRLPEWAQDDWCRHLAWRGRVYPHGQPWLLFSGAGARSRLHRDQGATMAWFAQLHGQKDFILHSPEDRPYLSDGQVDPRQPDGFPLYAKSHPVKLTLGPGELLFLPPDWYHDVVTQSPSITLTGNLVNHLNFGDYLKFAYGDGLDEVLAALPFPAPPAQRSGLGGGVP
jgi:hypothetical protein